MADVIDRILKRLMAMAVFVVALFLISYVTFRYSATLRPMFRAPP